MKKTKEEEKDTKNYIISKEALMLHGTKVIDRNLKLLKRLAKL